MIHPSILGHNSQQPPQYVMLTEGHFSFKRRDYACMIIQTFCWLIQMSITVSYRNELDGSRFVSCLVEVFREKAGHGDVLSMLIMVNDKLSKMGDIGKKQIGQPITTLPKTCFFGLDCTRKHFTWPANPAMISHCTYPHDYNNSPRITLCTSAVI